MNPATAFWTLIGFAGLIILTAFLYRDYRIDLFRERMFALRDELFRMAANGDLSFDHPAYGLMRSTLNGLIRYADAVTLSTMFGFAFAGPMPEEALRETEDRIKGAMSTLTPAQNDAILKLTWRMHRTIAEQILMRSIVFAPAVLLGHIGFSMLEKFAKLKRIRLFDAVAWGAGNEAPA